MRRLTIAAILLITGLLVAAAPKVTKEIRGNVVGVTDGDTIKVLVDKQTIKVRLEGIDAPESGQSYGSKSKQALSQLAFGKDATVRKTGIDRYGRTLGIVIVAGVDVNAKMLEDGWAWHFKKYNDEERLAKLEAAARTAKRGLWADDTPIAPWDYRAKRKRPKADSGEQDPNALHWLNVSSGVRHNESCKYFRKTKRGRLCGPNEGQACGICGG